MSWRRHVAIVVLASAGFALALQIAIDRALP